MKDSVSEPYKHLVWITSGSVGVGLVVRRAHDALSGLPLLGDAPFVDVSGLLFGASILFLWFWEVLTIRAIKARKPWAEATEHCERCFPDAELNYKLTFRCLRCMLTFAAYILPYFGIAALACIVLVAGDVVPAILLFSGWCWWVLVAWAVSVLVQKGVVSNGPQVLEANVVELLKLPEDNGTFIVLSLLVALTVGTLAYGRISQQFGGGRPEKVVLFLKPGVTAILPNGKHLESGILKVLFRRGSKLGITSSDTEGGGILILDDSQIDHLYVGKAIEKRDH